MARKFYAAIAAGLVLTATPASSATLLFTVTGTDAVSFSLDTAVPVTPVHLNGPPPLDYDYYGAIPTLYNGASGPANISFYDAPSGGGFQVTFGNTYISPIGAVVFAGTLANPIFAPGIFSFTQDYTRGAINDRLVISDQTAPAVPEPATWTMMILGLLSTGFALRLRQGGVGLKGSFPKNHRNAMT